MRPPHPSRRAVREDCCSWMRMYLRPPQDEADKRPARPSPRSCPMTIDPNEAASSLKDIALVERRTREALFYAGSSAIFIMWGILVASGYGLTVLYPRSAWFIWLAVTALGCVATASIIAMRRRASSQ